MAATDFDEVGGGYGTQLDRGLRLTGEPAEYYAARRIARVRELVEALGVTPRAVLDFGCGTGSSLGLLRDAFPDARILGFEPEPELAKIAGEATATARAELIGGAELDQYGIADVVYCNGVFHHIAPESRARAMASVARALRADGLACVWENSPFNPGTRLVMARIPFDRNAILLSPRELRSLQTGAGLTPVTTEYHFVFPKVLGFARNLERRLRALPLGGQYVVAGRLGRA
jgi:SAM-dependent methyltransferase